jgi:hypothetical protein
VVPPQKVVNLTVVSVVVVVVADVVTDEVVVVDVADVVMLISNHGFQLQNWAD